MKKLFKGVFSFRCEIERHYSKAGSKEQAKVFMLRKIAIKHEVPYSFVYGMFDGNKNNYFIEEETVSQKSMPGGR